MNFHILTLFPDMVMQGIMTSITGRAVKEHIIEAEAVNIRDYASGKHQKTDDYPYGGGAGMLMQAQPVYDACQDVFSRIPPEHTKRVVYVTPQGLPFSQKMAEEFSGSDDLVILCGHYEGIDERVLEEVVTDYVSIGDYVLTGGELAAMVVVDAVARLVPGVLHNAESPETESFHGNLLEYPQYSRPEIWHGKRVPEVLLSGDARKIQKWRLEESVKRTRERRPDLYARYRKLEECRALLETQKRLYADMLALIDRGSAEVLIWEKERILLRDSGSGCLSYASFSLDGEEQFWEQLPEAFLAGCFRVTLHQDFSREPLQRRIPMELSRVCYHVVYTPREKIPCRGLYRTQDGSKKQLVIRERDGSGRYGVYGCLGNDNGKHDADGCLGNDNGKYGVSAGEDCLGVSGIDEDGRISEYEPLLEAEGLPAKRALWTFLINRVLEQGKRPYFQIDRNDGASLALLEEMGLYVSQTPVYQMESGE